MEKSKSIKELYGSEMGAYDDLVAAIFANLESSYPAGVVMIRVSGASEDELEKVSDYEIECNNIYDLMDEEELAAYDLIDNFIHSGDAGLPDDPSSLEARIEHAKWNNEEYRDMLVKAMSDLESSIAHYANLKVSAPELTKEHDLWLDDIVRGIKDIRYLGRELQRLIKIEEADSKIDEASIIMAEAFEDRDALVAAMKEEKATEAEDN